MNRFLLILILAWIAAVTAFAVAGCATSAPLPIDATRAGWSSPLVCGDCEVRT